MKKAEHNITALLDEVAVRNPDRPALIFGNAKLSFEKLLKRTNQCAHLLQENGLHPGERVIIMVPMSPELYVTMLAVMRCGAVAVFVDPWIPMKQIAAFSAFASPAGFIGIPKSHLLRLINRKLSKVRLSVSTSSVALGIPAKTSLTYAAKHASEMQPAAVSLDDPALITFTSGSSGIPKGANRTHGFLKAQYEALCHEMDYRNDDIDLPMFPVFALRNLAAGITSVIPEMDFRKVAEVDPEIINRQIKANGVTLVTASPPFIDRLAGIKSTPELRKVFTGGAPVNADQLKQWEAAFPNTEIEIIYGSTEAEPVAHLSSQERIKADTEEGFCCGKPTELLKTRIVEIRKGTIAPEELDALTLPQGQTGELLVSGTHVCRDYFHNPEAARENKVFESNGTCWHRMGDTGYFDKQGRFFLTGRVHSTIIRNGEILHAQLVEAEVIKKVPTAARIAALEFDGKLVVVIEGIKEETPIDADRVIFTNRPLPVDPRHNSKIDYSKLRKQVEKGQL